jgi:hypothetical protein
VPTMDLRRRLLATAFAGVVLVTTPNGAAATSMTSATQPPVIETAGVYAGVWRLVPSDVIVQLAFSVTCPAGKPTPLSVVFSDAAERVTERMGEPCNGEWASNPNEGNLEGDFVVEASSGSPITGVLPRVTFSPHWEAGIHPFLYQVIGPGGVIAQAPVTVNTTSIRLIYRGNPEYPAKCVEPRRAARSTEPNASCLVAGTVSYYKGWPPPPTASGPPNAPPPSPRASGHKCGGFLLGPTAIDLIEDIRTHGVACSVARAVAKDARDPGASFDTRTKYRSHGFSCHGRFFSPPGGGNGHIHFRCAHGRKVVTFIHN